MSQTILTCLKDNYFMLFYGVALVVSLYKYRLYYNSILKYLPILIGYTLLTEILGTIIRDIEEIQIVYIEAYSHYNSLVYSIFKIVFLFYFYFVFWKIIKNVKYKSIIKYGALAYLITTLINPFFVNFIIFPQIYASTIGAFVLIISILLYFKEILSNQKNKNTLLVWIGIGLLIFHVFYLPIQYAGRFDYDLYQKYHFRQIHHFIIALMYSCYIIGFLKIKRRFSK